MKYDILLEIIFLQAYTASTIYQNGYFEIVKSVNNLKWNMYFNRTILFQSPYFQHIPQISIHPILLEAYENTTSLEMGFMALVQNITTTQYDIMIFGPAGTVNYLYIYWVAVDDQRVEILCNFNIVNLTSPQYLQHNNPNAQQGIIVLTSFHGYTEIDFTLSLGTINSTTVEVIIQQQNMKSLSYIVILGPPDFFQNANEVNLLPLDQYNMNAYSNFVYNETNTVWLYFFKYFSFKFNGDLRIQFVITNATTTITYKFSTWTYQGSVNAVLTKFTHQSITLDFNLFVYKPITVKNIRITTILLNQTNEIELFIPEIQKNYTELISNDSIQISSNIEAITFTFKVKCNQNKQKITAQLYNCTKPTCSTNYSKIMRYCFSSELFVLISTRFNSQQGQDNQYKQIQISMTKTQVSIYQIVTNQISEQILIALFQIE